MTDNVLDYEPKTDPETGRELLPNPERGCGYLEESKGYIRCDPARDGEIPAFVTFDPPVPYKEGTIRSYQQFDGLAFQRSLANFDTVPEGDGEDLWDRLEDSEDGSHWGAIGTAYAQDLLMWVGETYYDDPMDFVDEARRFGLNKAIPVSKRQEPPAILPMKTRCFLAHPTAFRVYEQPVEDPDDPDDPDTEKVRVNYRDDDNVLGEDDAETPIETIPGIIGYSYLTRVVWTAPSDGDLPKWVQEYAEVGKVDIVDVGEPIPEDEVERRLAEFDGSLTEQEAAHKAADVLAESPSTQTPGHGEEQGSLADAAEQADQSDSDTDEADSGAADAADRDAVTSSGPEILFNPDTGTYERAEPDDDGVLRDPEHRSYSPDAWSIVDGLPDDYNELKRVAACVDADVSAQPSAEELTDAINATRRE